MRAIFACFLFLFSVSTPAHSGPDTSDMDLRNQVVKKIHSIYENDLQVISFQHKKSQLLLCVRQGLVVAIAVIPPKEQQLKTLKVMAEVVNGTKASQGLLDHLIPVSITKKSPTFDQDNVSTTGIFNVCYDLSSYNLKIEAQAQSKIVTEFSCRTNEKVIGVLRAYEIIIQNNEISFEVRTQE
jgi:hypothetical protein